MVAETNEAIDWARVRADFPVTQRWAYLNTAAAGPVSRVTMEAALRFYRESLEDADRHWPSWLNRREQARANIARLLNAEPDEIGLTTNTSSGMNLIVDALGERGEVISCALEFPVSTVPWLHRGVRVHLLEPRQGVVTPDDINAAMSERTGVICLSHVQYSNGLRSNLAEIGARKNSHAFVVNAAQSAGVFEIDVKRMRIDALCATGHKWLLGGYGSGFVYLSRELLQATRQRAIGWLSVADPFAMRNDEVRVRADAAARAELGCPHFGGIFALGAAVEYALQLGGQQIEQRALALNRKLTDSLREAGWRVLSPLADEAYRSAETLVAVAEPERVAHQLHLRGVAVTQKPEGIRVATHFFNDESDIARLIAALAELRG
jgi:cysteine desulfurase / selenocysteine lyase